MSPEPTSPEQNSAEKELAKRTRRSLLVMGGSVLAAAGGAGWLASGKHPEGDIPPNLRRVLNMNEKVVRATLGPDGLAPTFPKSAITHLKVNGQEGLEYELVPEDWRLDLKPYGSSAVTRKLVLDDVKTLPRFEETIEFKCVEGWSAVTRFAGARLSDFTAKFCPGSEKAATVGMKTPDEVYYVSVDTRSAMHPQTLLAWEMNGEPLTDDHGAPLRLVIPVKYGIKNIKRIGLIEYTDQRPPDYWAERGYDWYAGL